MAPRRVVKPPPAWGRGPLLQSQAAAPRGTARTRRPPVFGARTRHSHTLARTRPRNPVGSRASCAFSPPPPNSVVAPPLALAHPPALAAPFPGTAPCGPSPLQVTPTTPLPSESCRSGRQVLRRPVPFAGRPPPCPPYLSAATVDRLFLPRRLQRCSLCDRCHHRGKATCA